jgi:hypothetical protein
MPEHDGYYWARYKDIGWFLVEVCDGKLIDHQYFNTIEGNGLEIEIVPTSQQGKYTDFRLIEKPEFYG